MMAGAWCDGRQAGLTYTDDDDLAPNTHVPLHRFRVRTSDPDLRTRRRTI